MSNRDLIILLHEPRTEPNRVLSRGSRDHPAILPVSWSRYESIDFRSPRLAGILYEITTRGEARGRALSRLRRLARGLPLLPFRVAVPAPRRGAGCERSASDRSDSILQAPLQPRLLLDLLARDRLIGELRQRGRRTTAQSRDYEARLEAFAAIVRATGNELDPQKIVDLAMERIRSFLHPRAWIFLLFDADQEQLTVIQARGEGMAAMKGVSIGAGKGIAGRAAQKRQAILVEDVGRSGATYGAPELPRDLVARSVLAVPLISRGRVIGVIEAIDAAGSGRFSNEDARLLALLLEPAAVAVDNALLLRRSEELSITDDLTKLYNSRFLNATLRREVERSKRYRTPVSLIFLDLDGFKNVNDQHGHLYGSRTLVEVGAVIKGTVREIDIVSRFGGDEFTVILPQTGPEGAMTIAERIRQRIADTSFLQEHGIEVRISASFGIASFPDHGKTKDELIARADQAMYAAKGRGKNGVALAETESPQPRLVQTVR